MHSARTNEPIPRSRYLTHCQRRAINPTHSSSASRNEVSKPLRHSVSQKKKQKTIALFILFLYYTVLFFIAAEQIIVRARTSLPLQYNFFEHHLIADSLSFCAAQLSLSPQIIILIFSYTGFAPDSNSSFRMF